MIRLRPFHHLALWEQMQIASRPMQEQQPEPKWQHALSLESDDIGAKIVMMQT